MIDAAGVDLMTGEGRGVMTMERRSMLGMAERDMVETVRKSVRMMASPPTVPFPGQFMQKCL